MKRFFKFILLSFGLAAILVIMVAVVMLTDQKFAPKITQYSVMALNNLNRDLDFKIDKIDVKWHEDKSFLKLKAANFGVRHKATNNTIAFIPAMALKINLLYLFRAQLVPSEITLTNPVINIKSKLGEDKFDISNFASLFILDRLNVTDAVISINDKRYDIKEARIKIDQTKNKFEIDDAHILFTDKFELSLKAKIAKDFSEAEITTDFSDFEVKKLALIWPSNKAPDAREWVLGRISNAFVKKAHAVIDIKDKYFKEGCFPHDAINATVEFNNLDLNYEDALLKINKMEGTAKFHGDEVIIKGSGHLPAGSKLENTSIIISFKPEDPKVTISSSVSGNIGDVTAFIPKDTRDKLEKQKIMISKFTGSAATKLDITIPLIEHLTYNDIIFNVNSDFKDFTAPVLPYNLDFTDSTLKANFNGKSISFEGKGKIRKDNAKIKFIANLTENESYKIEINTDLRAINFNELKLLDEIIIKDGVVGTSLVMNSTNQQTNLNLKLNLENAHLSMDKIGFYKPEGDKSLLDVTANLTGTEVIVNKLALTLDGVDVVTGSFKLNMKDLTPTIMQFDHIKYGKNDYSLNYVRKKIGAEIRIAGNLLDFTKLNVAKLTNDTGSKERLTSHIKIKNLLMQNNQSFKNMEGVIACADICDNINVTSDYGTNAKLKIFGTKTDFVINADDAGALFNSLNLYSKMKNGVLILNAKRDAKNKITGKIEIDSFQTSNQSIAIKLLSSISIPGILNSLSNITNFATSSDVPFTKLNTDFTLENKIFKLENGKIEGNQVGFRMEGNINFTEKRLDINGKVVPEYIIINRLVSNIPLLGNILQGGKDKPFLAANFTIKGGFDNPSIFVNPISVIAPGVVRETIFK